MAYSFPISKNAFKMFPNPKTMVMVGYYTSQASHPYLVHNFLNFILLQLIVLQIVPLIGLILPLIKMQIKLFQNPQPIAWLASTLNKLSNHLFFMKFWVGLIPQINVLLQLLNNKIENKKGKGLE